MATLRSSFPGFRNSARVPLVLVIVAASLAASCSLFKPGTVYGEFHDASLFAKSAERRPEINRWNDEQLWEGGTGATIQAKTFGHAVGKASVLLNGKEIAAADGWGQFTVKLSPGTYSLVGICEGYGEQRLDIEVKSGEKMYVNIILKPSAKTE